MDDSPTALKYTVTGVDATGKAIQESYNGAPDGQPYATISAYWQSECNFHGI